jgi:hypothetical protein
MKFLFLAKTKTDFTCFANQANILIIMLVKMGFDVDLYDYSIGVKYDINNRKKQSYNYGKRIKILDPLYNYLAFSSFYNDNRGKYDITQVMYVRPEFYFLAKSIGALGKKGIVCVYGSDVNKAAWLKRFFKKIFSKDALISFTTTQTRDTFIKKYGIKNNSNLVVNSFPITKLSSTDTPKRFNRDLFCKKYGIDIDNVVVVCGMSGFYNEQIEKLVDSIGGKHYPNTVFVFTFTYGISGDKLEKLSAYVKQKMGTNKVVLIKDYLKEEEVLSLRLSTDILINIRKKDQAGGALIESLSAGSYVITGSWLPYRFLSDMGVYLKTIDKVSALPEALSEALELIAKQETRNKFANNTIILNENFSLEKTLNQWKEFYLSVIASLKKL